MAKANRQLGMNDIQKEKDDLAINTMQAFMDVVYYQGTVKLAAEQLEENRRILYKTRRQEELGLKGKADVAQIEAQVAANDYNLTHQQNLLNTAILTLKQNMNFPSDMELAVVPCSWINRMQPCWNRWRKFTIMHPIITR